MTAETVVDAVAWSAAGFVVGFVFCWLMVHSPDSVSRPGGFDVVIQKLAPADWFRAMLGILILAMGLFASFQYYRVTSCQAEYNEQVAQSLTARSEAQRVSSLAQVKLLTATLSGNPGEGQKAIQEYIGALNELERVRAATPYPKPADCGVF